MDLANLRETAINRSDGDRVRGALQRSLQELHDLKFAIDQADIVSTTNPAGQIVYANDKMLEISKYSREEIIGKSHRALNSGYHPKEFFQNLWETVAAGRIWKGEIRNKAKDGSFFWVDTTIVPFIGEDGKPYQFMSIRKDITGRKMSEALLEQERTRNLNVERLTALGEMAAGIAHEIKNPLSAILLQAQMLQREEKNPIDAVTKMARAGEQVERTVRRIEKIITNLQALCRNAEFDPLEEVSVKKLFEDATDFCRESFAKHQIKLIVEEKGLGLTFPCRAAQISQVLLNLLNNAKDAIEHLEDRWVRLSAEEDDSYVSLSVTDCGAGISPELRPKVMEAFFTTKENGKGTGIGLNISKKILESHGGALLLDVASANTRFVCKIPKREANPHGGYFHFSSSCFATIS